MAESLYNGLGTLIVLSPFVLLVMLGTLGLFGIKPNENLSARLTQMTVGLGLVGALGILILMLATGQRQVPFELGTWVSIPEEHFHFRIKFLFDRLSLPFCILSYVLCGVVGAFTQSYLHRETGYHRFFFLYAVFLTGMVMSSLAGTIETLFFGWELVGLSSALLVAYFHEHENPVRNGQRVWTVYRLSDAAFLIAALTLHHVTGGGDFSKMVGTGEWPLGESMLTPSQAALVGSFLIVAAAGKSGLVPFSGWLPRAMEGPTPSSAVFYGALSVHLGAYLLLRVSPILHQSLWLSAAVILLGAVTAATASILSRVQCDVKSALAYASLTQVGIIVVEIGLGWHYLALIHIVGHAALRTLQLLRAPSLLRDYQSLENAIGGRLRGSSPSPRLTPRAAGLLYRFGYERGFLDTLLDNWIVHPFVAIFRWADQRERAWTQWLEALGKSKDRKGQSS